MIRTRGAAQSYDQDCKCILHDQNSILYPDKPNRVFRVFWKNEPKKKNKEIKQKDHRRLLDKKLLTEKDSYVCKICLESEYDYSPPPTVPIPSDERPEIAQRDPLLNDISATIDSLMDKLQKAENLDDVCEAKLSKLFSLVAIKFVSKEVSKDCLEISSVYKDINDLQTLDSKQFILARVPLLVNFIANVVGYSIERTTDHQYLFAFASTIENIYHLKNQNAILPHSFLINLIQSFVSGSKTVTALNNSLNFKIY